MRLHFDAPIVQHQEASDAAIKIHSFPEFDIFSYYLFYQRLGLGACERWSAP